MADALRRRGLTPDPRRLLLVNPNTSAAVTGWLAEEARRVAGASVTVVAVNARSGLAGIETPEQAEQAARAVVEAVAEGSPAAAAIIGAFGDPGLREARARALMPVIGLGEEALREAGRGGRRFTIVTLGAAMRRPIRDKAAALGLGEALADVRILPFSLADMISDRQARREAILREMRVCETETVLLGGAPFAGLARELGEEAGRIALDGVEAALRAALDA